MIQTQIRKDVDAEQTNMAAGDSSVSAPSWSTGYLSVSIAGDANASEKFLRLRVKFVWFSAV